MCVCMITGMVFLYVNVCLYLNVNFVILYVVVQRAKRKTAVAILVPQFSYFNFHMNFSCKLSVYIYYVFSVWRLKINSILFYSILFYSILFYSILFYSILWGLARLLVYRIRTIYNGRNNYIYLHNGHANLMAVSIMYKTPVMPTQHSLPTSSWVCTK